MQGRLTWLRLLLFPGRSAIAAGEKLMQFGLSILLWQLDSIGKLFLR